MRHARIRPPHTDTFMHLYNRVGGHVGEYPFGPCEKEYFINLMHKLTNLYTVQIVAYQLMGNHFHMIGFAPGAALTEADAVDRFNRYYDGKRVVIAGSPRAELLPNQLRDVSRFMKDLQQGFTRWFNRTRPIRRRGHLWQAGRLPVLFVWRLGRHRSKPL